MRAAAVLECAAAVVAELPTAPEHRALLALHFEVAREQVAATPRLPPVELPLLVHAAAAGDENGGRAAVPLAAACLFTYLGADLLDNVADDELEGPWLDAGPAAATLAGATMLAVLPRVALERVEPRPPATTLNELTRLFAGGMLAMSAGQYADVATPADVMTLERCRAIADCKSGSQGDLYARAGATLAGARPAAIDAYAGFGRAVVTGAQVASDLGDLVEPGGSRDIAAGKRTLPLVHALGRLDDAGRKRLEAVLAAGDEPAELLASARSLHHTALVVELYRQRALKLLDEAGAREPARGDLVELAAELSSLSPREGAR